ncbi:unnamed protein product, partial [Urochloa humidicola]
SMNAAIAMLFFGTKKELRLTLADVADVLSIITAAKAVGIALLVGLHCSCKVIFCTEVASIQG